MEENIMETTGIPKRYIVLDGYCFFSGPDGKTRDGVGTVLHLTDEQLKEQDWKVALLNVAKVRCNACGKVFETDAIELLRVACPHCPSKGCEVLADQNTPVSALPDKPELEPKSEDQPAEDRLDRQQVTRRGTKKKRVVVNKKTG